MPGFIFQRYHPFRAAQSCGSRAGSVLRAAGSGPGSLSAEKRDSPLPALNEGPMETCTTAKPQKTLGEGRRSLKKRFYSLKDSTAYLWGWGFCLFSFFFFSFFPPVIFTILPHCVFL